MSVARRVRDGGGAFHAKGIKSASASSPDQWAETLFEAGDSAAAARDSAVVFDWRRDVDTAEARTDTRDEDASKRVKRTMLRLATTGGRRPIARPPRDWQKRLQRLALSSPNFQAVIDTVILPHVALTARGVDHRMPPTLLVGKPGIGKSRIASAVQDILGVPPPLSLSMASQVSGAALSGTAIHWSNSTPGSLFELMAWGRGGPAVANPLLVLDEVDKAPSTEHAPLGALYDLLEADTAATFVDLALPDVAIDMSRVRILLTANDAGALPEPLLSRMFVFEIEAPSGTDIDAVAREVLREAVGRLGVAFDAHIPAEVLQDARDMAVRELRVRLEAALAHALIDGRSRLQAKDWQRVSARPRSRRRAIGFTA